MDPILNPFSPGAGSPPPELVGRDAVLDQAHVLLGRVALGRPEKSMLLTGLRGVGKTVLLNELARIATASNYRTIFIEAHENKPLAALLAPQLRKLLFDLNRIAGAGEKVRRGLAVLKGFVGKIKISLGEIELGLDIDPEHGTADSGDLEADLPELMTVVAEAAKDRNIAIAIFIDEVQYFSREELSSLIMTMHKMQQLGLPVVLIGAGLPILPGLAGDSKSYAERLFSFPDIGALSQQDTTRALQGPVQAVNVSFEEKAIEKIYALTRGYPYFLQEWGYQSWNKAVGPTITADVINSANEEVVKRLDENFFRVRFARLTPGERKFLRAMAEIGDSGTYRISDVADALGSDIGKLGPVRARIIKKGMIYSPSHGDIAFTVPLFSDFMRRAMPDF
jgi:hypothetical protein